MSPKLRYGLRVALFAIAVVVFLGPFGILVRETTTGGTLAELDLSPAKDLHPVVVRSPGLVVALEVISFIGSPPWFYLLLGGSAIFLWLKRRRAVAAFITVTGLMGGVVDTAVKLWVDRPRPSIQNPVATAPENSFPSGHTMMSTIGYGVLVLVFLPLIPRKWRMSLIAAAIVLVGVIGCARVALGVHFVSDVVGGFVLGVAWLVASTIAFSLWRTEEGEAPVKPLEGVAPESIKTL